MRVVVVGGVAGGMSAAARLRRLNENAEIIVVERGGEVSFANCGLPYYVSGEITDKSALLVQTPESLRAALNLDVRINTEVTAVDPEQKTVTLCPTGNRAETTELSYDELILSPGALANTLPIPGADSPRITTLRTVPDALALEEAAGKAQFAVVMGGGFIGVETAEALHMRGVETALVELNPHVLPPLEDEMAHLVHEELQRLGIRVHAGVGAERIEVGKDRDTVVLADGTELQADIIIASIGVRPDTDLWESAGVETLRGAIVVDEAGKTTVPHIWAVGDATVSIDHTTGQRRPIALAGPANRAGRLVADAIAGETPHRIPAAAGTAIVRVGELTAAMTGANRQSLAAAGIDYHTIHLHPMNHAGYFPGATQLHLMVHFGTDGKILGAQAVGRDGVDKRIDVLAVAMKAGLRMADLIDLDLAYAPPYGAAKDPVNLAGMMGANVLDGTLRLWYAQDLQQVQRDCLVLDVRSAGEFAGGHLPGALNIPHTELRDRMDEVREAAAGRPVAVHCASGMRSYLAHRQLQQAGLDSRNLSGGMLTLQTIVDPGVLVTPS